MNHTQPVTLEYAPVRNERRRLIAGLIFLILIVIGAMSAWEHRAAIQTEAKWRWTAWSIYRAQQACLTDFRPANEIVFEEIPAAPTAATTMPTVASARKNSPLAAFESALSVVSPRFIFHNAPSPALLRLQAQQLQALRAQQASVMAQLTPEPSLPSRGPAAGATIQQFLQSRQQWAASQAPIRAQLQSLKAQIATLQSQPVGLITTGIPGTATSGSTTLFVHERSNDAGAKRLLAVTADPTNLYLSLYSLAERQSPPRLLLRQTITRHTAPVKVRLYAGQPDPSDPRRFSIRYEVGDRTGTLRGTLRDDSHIDLLAPGWIDNAGWLPPGSGFEPGTWRGTPQELPLRTAITQDPVGITFLDDSRVAVATATRIQIIDLAKQTVVALDIQPATSTHSVPTRVGVFSTDGSKLLLIHDTAAQMVSSQTGRTLWELPTVGSSAVGFSIDGSAVVMNEMSAREIGLAAFDALTGKRLRTLNDAQVPELDFRTRSIFDAATDSIFILNANKIFRYDVATGQSISRVSAARQLRAAADRLILLDNRSLEVLSTMPYTTVANMNFSARSSSPRSEYIDAVSRDGQRVVFSGPSSAFVTAPDAGWLIQIPFSPPNPIPIVGGLIGAVSPDNQQVVLLDASGHLLLYDLSRDVDPPLAKVKP